MKRKKINNIIIFFLALIAFIFIVNTKSCEAKKLNKLEDLFSGGYEHLGDTITLSYDGEGTDDSLERHPYSYCFQRALSCVKSTYEVRAYIVIDGNWATRYYHNGDRAKGASGYSVDSTSNMVLGYIFGNNEYTKGFTNYEGVRTASQVALWGFGDTWMNDVGNHLFQDRWTVVDIDDYNNFEAITKGKQYANVGKFPDNPTVSFDGSSKKEYNNTENGEILGPFKVNFNSNRIHITSISVKDNYGNDIQDGISFYLNKNGTNSVSANNITQDQEFYIKNTTNRIVDSITVNVQTDTIYNVEMWFLHCYKESSQELLAVKPSNYTKTASTTLKIKSTGSLYIHKEDEETGATLEGAGFKIYKKNSGWLKGTSYPYEFVNDISQATEYTMDNNNKTDYVQYGSFSELPAQYQGKKGLKIDVLRSGIYHIYETKAPTGLYKLNLQNGYDGNNKYVDTGIEIKVGTQQDGASWDHFTNITNVQKISIKGYVWAEGRPDKPENNENDNKYNKGSDHRVSNITVKLFKKGNENPIATTTTNANGEYEFIDIVKRTELDNYYVLFDYGEGRYSYSIEGKTINKTIKDGNKYIPVAFLNEEEGSKALSLKIPYEDTEVGSVAYTYGGNVKDMINTYGLAKIGTMDNENLVLKNINLGIKEMLKPEFSVINNIADVRISINGYNYNYKYAGGDEKDANFTDYTPEGPAVKWQNKNVSHAYSRPVYPSDVIYDKSIENTKELDVKVTYRIDITNTTTYNVKELYVENKLLLNKITDKFDKNRYELEDKNWNDDNNGTATMKDGYLQSIQTKNGNKGINSKETVTAYITFNVTNNAILDILNHPDGIIENNPTEVSAEGYHEYYRDDYSWENNIKKDGQPHKTENSLENAEAPYLVFTIKPDGIKERTVSGKVFKDNVTAERGESGEVVGDGKYQESSEKGISGVKVELLGENMNVTKLYQAYTENDVVKTRVIDAVVITDENGGYSLNGVVPGKYYLRFTYGNGQYKITDLTGTTLKEGTYETKIQGSSDTINAGDYKSTIRNSGLVDLINNKAELWYKEDGFKTGKYSVALDELEKRKAINEDANIKEMSADSSKISVTIENTKNDEAQEIPASNNLAIQGKTLLNDQNKNIKYNFDGFYFGVIEMPKARANIEKLITNVKIANAQGNVLYNGNPEKLNQGSGVAVTDLDNKENGGSSYVRAEMVETSIYGSSLELIYQVKVTNTSDVNYYLDDYYLYGDKGNGSKEVTIKPTEVYDYLDKSLTYVKEESTKLNNNNDKRIVEGAADKEITVDGQNIRAQEFKLEEWGKLYTNKIKNRDGNHPTTDSVNIFAKRILTREDDDMEIVSYATITQVDNSTSGDDGDEEIKLVRKAEKVNANAKAIFTITPPTGNTTDNLTYYAIAGIVSLVVIAVGIVIIKKKIV